jgi:DNA-nicking Smr family endonuclease
VAEFSVEREGERVFGLARGIDAARLRELRRGAVAWERELDLHGLTRREAHEDLAFELDDARREGERCVRVVVGRGTHSSDGGVLRDAVVEWLQERPLSDGVMAFASAPAAAGGPGALLVLLRSPNW